MDEGTLRERFPEIPWDQPVELVLSRSHRHDVIWVCRYCVALDALGSPAFAAVPYNVRDEALEHIDRAHHD